MPKLFIHTFIPSDTTPVQKTEKLPNFSNGISQIKVDGTSSMKRFPFSWTVSHKPI
jgi:hypothetical protein